MSGPYCSAGRGRRLAGPRCSALCCGGGWRRWSANSAMRRSAGTPGARAPLLACTWRIDVFCLPGLASMHPAQTRSAQTCRYRLKPLPACLPAGLPACQLDHVDFQTAPRQHRKQKVCSTASVLSGSGSSVSAAAALCKRRTGVHVPSSDQSLTLLAVAASQDDDRRMTCDQTR